MSTTHLSESSGALGALQSEVGGAARKATRQHPLRAARTSLALDLPLVDQVTTLFLEHFPQHLQVLSYRSGPSL